MSKFTKYIVRSVQTMLDYILHKSLNLNRFSDFFILMNLKVNDTNLSKKKSKIVQLCPIMSKIGVSVLLLNRQTKFSHIKLTDS